MTHSSSLLIASSLCFALFSACTVGDLDDDVGTGDGDMGGAAAGDGDGTPSSGGGDGDGDDPLPMGGFGGMGGSPGDACMMPLPTADIDIIGIYGDDLSDLTTTITADTWDTGYSTHYFSEVDNDFMFATARNTADDIFAPCLWSLFVWYEEDGSLYYCQATADAESESLAVLTEFPDSNDLQSGCNGFGWTELLEL